MQRKDSPWDIVIFGVIGVALLALLPANQQSPARLCADLRGILKNVKTTASPRLFKRAIF
jgi:hypothetical protein